MSIEASTPERTRSWTRSYPPLALLAVAIVLAVAVLPSALNLPQSNPSTVLEYAPVPPQDENNPPAQNGNLGSLGLGSSNTLAQGAPPPPPPPPPTTKGTATTPAEFECVGNPPRQTSDPMSPPCVPFFQGDNFGSTYQGVTKDQITILVYQDWGTYGLTGRQETSPAPGSFVDIDQRRLSDCPPDQGAVDSTDPKQCDFVNTRMLKGFSHYFNTRYQTYKRHVHYWEYFSNASTAAGRRGDAVAIWEKLKPFAVIDTAIFNGFNQEFDTAMTQLGVLTFGSTQGSVPNATYRKNAPLQWGFWPDTEHWARLYSSYVCKKVAPFPVKHFGNPSGAGSPNGEKRKFGLWYPNDPAHPELVLFARIIKSQLASCGVHPVEASYSYQGYAVDDNDTGTEAEQAVARFRGAGTSPAVSTVLYVGTETRFAQAADAAKYYPEIVVAGDLNNDDNYIGQTQNQNVWRNAWAMTFHIRINQLKDSPGYRAYKEGDPNGDSSAGVSARDAYRDHFMLFQAIQVAGPRLTPKSVDDGFHAIPERSSRDPYEAAFFFDPNDYTSVKDATEAWWDPQGHSQGGGTPSSKPGCWRMPNLGVRYLATQWPSKDNSFVNANDPCTGYDGGIKLRL